MYTDLKYMILVAMVTMVTMVTKLAISCEISLILAFYEGFWDLMRQWKHIYGHVIHQNDRLLKGY